MALRAEFAQETQAKSLRGNARPPVEQAFSLLPAPDHDFQSAQEAQAENLRCAAHLPDHNVGGIKDSDWDREWDSAEISLHPALGLGMLAAKKSAAGRIWLLLRVLDGSGQGWLELTAVHQALTTPASALHICGPRQLRNLLAQGEGIFWEQRGGRIWLRSVPRVAAALGVQRLDGRPISLPVSSLTAGIGKVRAHLYAAFHSGRKKANPISRAALRQISQVSARSQQNYERRAGVQTQRNYATGSKLKSDKAQEQAWQKGPACFPWHDHQGLYGQAGSTFLAWQLPNSYSGPHTQRPQGRRKQFNRQLADLLKIGMTGNGRTAVEFKAKRYCDDAQTAVRSTARTQNPVYWRGPRPGSWYVMEPVQAAK